MCPLGVCSPANPSPRATPTRSVTPISDGILDALLAQDPKSRVAVETMVTTGQVHVAGEVTTNAYADIPTIVRKTILDIGYDSSAKGFDGNSCGVTISIGAQSPDIAQGVDSALRDPRRGLRGRDRATGRRRPGPDVRLRRRRHPRAHAAADRAGAPPGPPADRGPQATARCPTCARTARPRSPSRTTTTSPSGVDTVVVSTQHAADIDLETLLTPDIKRQVIKPVLEGARPRLRRTPASWSTRPAASSSAARWATPA